MVDVVFKKKRARRRQGRDLCRQLLVMFDAFPDVIVLMVSKALIESYGLKGLEKRSLIVRFSAHVSHSTYTRILQCSSTSAISHLSCL
jgi:hypothetical protein